MSRVLANPDIHRRLAERFVALRLDWEQGHHYRDRFGFILGTGDQLLLAPDGSEIRPSDGSRVYGRHGMDTTPELLDSIAGRFAQADTDGPAVLDLEWFYWSTRPSGNREGGRYPADPDQIARFARLPVAEVSGPLPAALQDVEFLRRHVRQFIWVRGDEAADSSIVLRRVRDGHPESLPEIIESMAGAEGIPASNLGARLDGAWTEYMRHRPLTARGYLDNPHGGWMRSQAEQMLAEDEDARRRAREGSLLPPGRHRE